MNKFADTKMKLPMYKVISIRHLNGTDRTDGRYPLRIGRLCNLFSDPEVGKCLYLEWVRNADGSLYSGWYRTSLVRQVERLCDGTVIVTTCNSIYSFCTV